MVFINTTISRSVCSWLCFHLRS